MGKGQETGVDIWVQGLRFAGDDHPAGLNALTLGGLFGRPIDFISLPTMLAIMRKAAVTLLTSPEPVEPPPARRTEAAAVIIAAGVAGAWIFAFLMRRYFGLGTGGDMYVNVQLATSWLEGRFLEDRLFGNYLSVHTYFFSPLLAVFVYPLGAPGLLLALALAASLGLIAMVRILRLLGVPGGVALAYAFISTLAPVSLQVYRIDETGFQVELLMPCMALWLAYFLLKRQWLGSLVLGLALQAVKEDAVLLLIPVTVTVACENFFRPAGSARPRSWREKWNAPALTVGLISVLVTPLLLYLVKSQPVQDYQTLSSFAKVHAVDNAPVTDLGSLWTYVTDNLFVWLSSAVVVRWLAVVLVGTWGSVIFRPHLLAVGVLTTLTAWLVQTNPMWAPRFAPTLAFIQLAGCLGFASACRLWRGLPRPEISGAWRTGALGFGGALVAGAGWYGQYLLAPHCTEVYRLAPTFEVAVSPDELRRADELFERYRREARPDEPVTASPYLFRYIHDRNFFWFDRLHGRPQPKWILWDQGDRPLSALSLYLRTDAGWDLSDYELVAQSGRFLLYRAWAGREIAPAPAPRPVAGEPDGMIRMKVRFSPGRAGTSEPILSLGAPGKGGLFFVHYLSEQQLVLGWDTVRLSVQLGTPIDYEPGREYGLELFHGALLSAGGADSPQAPSPIERLDYQNFLRVTWDGREALNTLAPPFELRQGEVYAGYNFVRSSSAVANFSGDISDVRRGGYPPLTGVRPQQFGAVKLTVELPAKEAGLAEPLAVVGVAGNATLGYVRLHPGGEIQVGADFWSIGAYESERLPVERSKPLEITYSFPVFYPPVGDPRWGDVPVATQEKLRTWLRITVNGAVVVDREVKAPIPQQPTVAFGKNPAGGSVVAAEFTGKVLQALRLPLTSP